jgi:CrcB protein
MLYLYLGLAGAVGALLRYGVGQLVQWWAHGFPVGTLLINLSGSFALGWFNQQLHLDSKWRTVFGTGLIGSYTTFSTFGVESMTLLTNRQWLYALLYLGFSLFGGLLFVYLGDRCGKRKIAS